MSGEGTGRRPAPRRSSCTAPARGDRGRSRGCVRRPPRGRWWCRTGAATATGPSSRRSSRAHTPWPPPGPIPSGRPRRPNHGHTPCPPTTRSWPPPSRTAAGPWPEPARNPEEHVAVAHPDASPPGPPDRLLRAARTALSERPCRLAELATDPLAAAPVPTMVILGGWERAAGLPARHGRGDERGRHHGPSQRKANSSARGKPASRSAPQSRPRSR